MTEWRMTTWSDLISEEGCFPVRWTHTDSSFALTVRFYAPDDIDDIEGWEVQALVKWDGCINWETHPECMAHFCEPQEADYLAPTFRLAWRLAADHLPNYAKG